jgi:hypothetical protein
MSYGVWKYRGKGWSAIEIDSPWNETLSELDRRSPSKADRLRQDCERECIDCGWQDNPDLLRWRYGQTKRRDRYITTERYYGGGEHLTVIAYEDEAAFLRAVDRLTGDWTNPLERQAVLELRRQMMEAYETREQYRERMHEEAAERRLQERSAW